MQALSVGPQTLTAVALYLTPRALACPGLAVGSHGQPSCANICWRNPQQCLLQTKICMTFGDPNMQECRPIRLLQGRHGLCARGTPAGPRQAPAWRCARLPSGQPRPRSACCCCTSCASSPSCRSVIQPWPSRTSDVPHSTAACGSWPWRHRLCCQHQLPMLWPAG